MNSTARFFLIIAALGAAAATAVILVLPRRAAAPTVPITDARPAGVNDLARPDPSLSDLFIPPFTLTNQDGESVTQAIFAAGGGGGYTAVSFIFTNCNLICPTLTAAMQTVAEKLKDTPVRLASFSVDPQRDTPEQLRAYAKRLEIDTSRWSLLTGDKAAIWGILEDGLKWHIEERPEQRIPLSDGSTMSNIAHPGWIALVGPDGKLVGLCTDIMSDDDLNGFIARARAISQSK